MITPHVPRMCIPAAPAPRAAAVAAAREPHGEAYLVRQHRVNTSVNTSPAVSTPTVAGASNLGNHRGKRVQTLQSLMGSSQHEFVARRRRAAL
eukprot:2891328-Prymnesium_polylepis.1